MHHVAGAHNIAAKGLTNTLMSQTNPKNGNLAGKGFNRRQRNTRLIWRAGAREITRCVGAKARISSMVTSSLRSTFYISAQLSEILHNVVGEGVVIIDH